MVAEKNKTTTPADPQQRPHTPANDPDPAQQPQLTRNMTTDHLLSSGQRGEPGIRVRGVALFMDNNYETLGINICLAGPRSHIAILPSLAKLMNGNTTRTATSDLLRINISVIYCIYVALGQCSG